MLFPFLRGIHEREVRVFPRAWNAPGQSGGCDRSQSRSRQRDRKRPRRGWRGRLHHCEERPGHPPAQGFPGDESHPVDSGLGNVVEEQSQRLSEISAWRAEPHRETVKGASIMRQ